MHFSASFAEFEADVPFLYIYHFLKLMANDSADHTVPPSGRFALQPVCEAVHHATYKQFQCEN
jgi:hypothetical protein